MQKHEPNHNGLALVTGAGRRLGREIALCLARAGYAIGLHYHHAEAEALETARMINEIGMEAHLLQADLIDEDQTRTMFSRLDALPHPLRVLVNSAAVMAAGDLRNMSSVEWDAVMNLNLRAPWLCSQLAAQRMPPGGVIINITDSGTGKAWVAYPAYIISKDALLTLTRLLARALAPDIRVNAVAPGLILPADDVPDEKWQRLVERLPIKRQGEPAEVASAVLFLIEHQYITGECIAVDGGYRLV